MWGLYHEARGSHSLKACRTICTGIKIFDWRKFTLIAWFYSGKVLDRLIFHQKSPTNAGFIRNCSFKCAWLPVLTTSWSLDLVKITFWSIDFVLISVANGSIHLMRVTTPCEGALNQDSIRYVANTVNSFDLRCESVTYYLVTYALTLSVKEKLIINNNTHFYFRCINQLVYIIMA